MKLRHLPVLAALLLGVGAAPSLAQKVKRPDVGSFRFVSGPKGDRPQVPGLNAALLLTDQQKEELVQAREETVGSEAVLAAGRKVKGDSNATEADRQAARQLAEEAQARLERRIQEILTASQKELVQRLQVLYGQAREAVGGEFASKLVAVKGNKEETARLRQEAADALTADFIRRVKEILTPEQRAAMDRAAAEERQREAAKPKKP